MGHYGAHPISLWTVAEPVDGRRRKDEPQDAAATALEPPELAPPELEVLELLEEVDELDSLLDELGFDSAGLLLLLTLLLPSARLSVR